MKKQSSKNYKSIRDYLKGTRQTEAELGKLARISQSHVNKLKNGTRRPTPEVAVRLEAITGIPLRILLFEIEKKAGRKPCPANSARSNCAGKTESDNPKRSNCLEKIS